MRVVQAQKWEQHLHKVTNYQRQTGRERVLAETVARMGIGTKNALTWQNNRRASSTYKLVE